MFSLYVFADHALVALSNRTFANCLEVREITNIDIARRLDYIEYNNKMIKVYIPNVLGDYDVDQ